jgi:hypothetical protein
LEIKRTPPLRHGGYSDGVVVKSRCRFFAFVSGDTMNIKSEHVVFLFFSRYIPRFFEELQTFTDDLGVYRVLFSSCLLSSTFSISSSLTRGEGIESLRFWLTKLPQKKQPV